MKAIEISDETADFIVSLVKEIEAQENHGTADPYYFSVQCIRELAAPSGTNDNVKYYWEGETYTEAELKKCCEENNLDFENEKDKAQEFCIQEVDEFENFFFTKRGYDEHIKLNGHNYRHFKRHDFYVRHAFRNPEILGLLKAIREIKSAVHGAVAELQTTAAVTA
jgi:hypothetical protein